MSSVQTAASKIDTALAHLLEHGYAIIENVLSDAQLATLRSQVDEVFTTERAAPIMGENEASASADAAVEAYMADSYSVSADELERLLQRVCTTRAAELDTPWPVDIADVNKTFLHLPTLFDEDLSQRLWNLLNKVDGAGALVEHPLILELVGAILGADCVLSDCSATSIGPGTGGGAWHVDVPLGQLAEPLPDFPLTTQNVWMLDDFTENNGATRVVPGSHLSRRKPSWSGDAVPDEITLTAPAGSVAIWLSNTWHQSGPNKTDQPRRAILCYYSRSWIKPFNDFRAGIPREKAEQFSPTLRYLIGYSAQAPRRG